MPKPSLELIVNHDLILKDKDGDVPPPIKHPERINPYIRTTAVGCIFGSMFGNAIGIIDGRLTPYFEQHAPESIVSNLNHVYVVAGFLLLKNAHTYYQNKTKPFTTENPNDIEYEKCSRNMHQFLAATTLISYLSSFALTYNLQ